ncbi:hypothetical protein C8J57DRAFT_1475408 [Mycena rebaudengoi]|nr:hypothetical protein C8J57DRAFT_1475408 [Mycena rebaudengoi]
MLQKHNPYQDACRAGEQDARQHNSAFGDACGLTKGKRNRGERTSDARALLHEIAAKMKRKGVRKSERKTAYASTRRESPPPADRRLRADENEAKGTETRLQMRHPVLPGLHAIAPIILRTKKRRQRAINARHKNLRPTCAEQAVADRNAEQCKRTAAHSDPARHARRFMKRCQKVRAPENETTVIPANEPPSVEDKKRRRKKDRRVRNTIPDGESCPRGWRKCPGGEISSEGSER